MRSCLASPPRKTISLEQLKGRKDNLPIVVSTFDGSCSPTFIRIGKYNYTGCHGCLIDQFPNSWAMKQEKFYGTAVRHYLMTCSKDNLNPGRKPF